MCTLRVFVLVSVFGSLVLGAFLGCAVDPSATDDAVTEPPAPGEEAGACLPDGTCDHGLECLDGVCATVEGQEEAEGEDEGGVEGEGNGAAEDDGGTEDAGGEENGNGSEGEADTLLIFHNGSGPMCLEALDWLDGVKSEHPTLVIEEHLTYEAGEIELLTGLEAQFETSEGVSSSFGYLPIMFFREHAFSGFDDEIAGALQELLKSAGSGSRRSSTARAGGVGATMICFVLRPLRSFGVRLCQP